jgi:hypothetical protein
MLTIRINTTQGPWSSWRIEGYTRVRSVLFSGTKGQKPVALVRSEGRRGALRYLAPMDECQSHTKERKFWIHYFLNRSQIHYCCIIVHIFTVVDVHFKIVLITWPALRTLSLTSEYVTDVTIQINIQGSLEFYHSLILYLLHFSCNSFHSLLMQSADKWKW